MSQQVLPEGISPNAGTTDPAVGGYQDDNRALKVAPSLRQLSRELRARSEHLCRKNTDTMGRADTVVRRYYELIFGQL